MSKQARIKSQDVPKGWSIDAVDFTNLLLQRKPANRLGLLGTSEVKEHPWLKNFPWKDLHDHKLKAPFIPKHQDNFDPKYCNANDKISENTRIKYELHLREEVIRHSFRGFEFNFGEHSKSSFINPHLKLSNTGDDRVLLEKAKSDVLLKNDIKNKSSNNITMPTTTLLKQYRQANGMSNGIGYLKRSNKKNNNDVNNASCITSNMRVSNVNYNNNPNLNNSNVNASNYNENSVIINNNIDIKLNNENNSSNNNSTHTNTINNINVNKNLRNSYLQTRSPYSNVNACSNNKISISGINRSLNFSNLNVNNRVNTSNKGYCNRLDKSKNDISVLSYSQIQNSDEFDDEDGYANLEN